MRVSGPLGLDGYFRVNEKDADQLHAVKGRWLNETSFQMVSRWILEGVEVTSTMTFHDDQVDIVVEDYRGVRGRHRGDSKN